ncbi:hypothetical protein CEXT_630101 [Caerostris extrusa]|uniref:Uncharacterized protein n=1 Tax=Caerostris extrusa TaxID=172846 RepID=A0AAV4YFI1_CAEEX|nr:hypothetical protein CEXT_630101 [Caerostris extrusa]
MDRISHYPKDPSLSYEIASLGDTQVPIGVYHASALKYFHQSSSVLPIKPLRKRSRPPSKTGQPVFPTISAGSSSRRPRSNQRMRMCFFPLPCFLLHTGTKLDIEVLLTLSGMGVKLYSALLFFVFLID